MRTPIDQDPQPEIRWWVFALSSLIANISGILLGRGHIASGLFLAAFCIGLCVVFLEREDSR